MSDPSLRSVDDQDPFDSAEPILDIGHNFEPILIDEAGERGFPTLDLP